MLFKKFVQRWTLGAWKHFAQKKTISKYNLLLMCVKTQIANIVQEEGMLNNLREICPSCGICGYKSTTKKLLFENFKWQFTSFADLRNEELVDDLLYLHDQIRYKDHDINFAGNKLSTDKKRQILRQFDPPTNENTFIVGVHWASCFNLIVGIGALGAQIFQTGVRRRKYKLGPTKQKSVPEISSLARVYISSSSPQSERFVPPGGQFSYDQIVTASFP